RYSWRWWTLLAGSSTTNGWASRPRVRSGSRSLHSAKAPMRCGCSTATSTSCGASSNDREGEGTPPRHSNVGPERDPSGLPEGSRDGTSRIRRELYPYAPHTDAGMELWGAAARRERSSFQPERWG